MHFNVLLKKSFKDLLMNPIRSMPFLVIQALQHGDRAGDWTLTVVDTLFVC